MDDQTHWYTGTRQTLPFFWAEVFSLRMPWPEMSKQYTFFSKASLHLGSLYICKAGLLIHSTESVSSDFKALHSRHCRRISHCLSDLEVQNSQTSDMEVLLIFPGAWELSNRNSSVCRVWQVNKVPAEQFQWIDAFFHQLSSVKLAFIIWNLFFKNFSSQLLQKERVELNINIP